MTQEKQNLILLMQYKQILEELEHVYKTAFDRLTTLSLGERKVAKIAQLLLLSRESAISPLEKEAEKLRKDENPVQS